MLRMQSTGGKSWFSVETSAAASFTEKGLKSGVSSPPLPSPPPPPHLALLTARSHSQGHPYTLSDGTTVRVVGIPTRTQEESGDDTGEWAEFSVAKWRSAMFTARSFFLQLFDDTTDFIAELCEKRGGDKKVLLIEIGCGTGEALCPLAKHCQYMIGIDVNPLFIDFCKDNCPEDQKAKSKYLVRARSLAR